MKPDAGPFRLGAIGRDAPAVLCLHGLTGTPYEVRPPAEALAAKGFACAGPELPGHGSSPGELARTSRSDWLHAVAAAFDELARQHERVYVLGLSMGGVLALELATRRAVAGLVVIAAPLHLRPLVRHAVPLLARFVTSLPKTPAILDPEARRVHPGYDRMPLAAVRELLELQREVSAKLDRVTAPLQLLYSKSDPTVPVSNADWIRERVAPSPREVHLFERSAHVLPVDYDRAEVAHRTVEFLTALERARRLTDSGGQF
jgi:carboxylesterase